MTTRNTIIVSIILSILAVWAVKADPVGKAACHAVCAMPVEGF